MQQIFLFYNDVNFFECCVNVKYHVICKKECFCFTYSKTYTVSKYSHLTQFSHRIMVSEFYLKSVYTFMRQRHKPTTVFHKKISLKFQTIKVYLDVLLRSKMK